MARVCHIVGKDKDIGNSKSIERLPAIEAQLVELRSNIDVLLARMNLLIGMSQGHMAE